ncbi:Mft1 [Kluyveromyces lactis]|nr:Mft1 [Kluyveromyces lactis]
MTTQEEAIERRLSLYSFNKVFPNYLSHLQQIQSLVHRLLNQKLTENDKLSVDEIRKLREVLDEKYLEAKNFVETERSSYNASDISLERTVDNIKNGLDGQLSVVRNLRDELNERNDRLNQMHLDITAFNEESVNLNTQPTIMRYTKEEWINILNEPEAFDKLLEHRVFKNVGDGLYSVTEELFDGELELKRMNEIMKKDIERLNIDLDEYKQKWLDSFEVMSKIGSVLKAKLNERRHGSEDNDEYYEEEEEADIERVKHDGSFHSEEESSFNTDEENEIYEIAQDENNEEEVSEVEEAEVKSENASVEPAVPDDDEQMVEPADVADAEAEAEADPVSEAGQDMENIPETNGDDS